MAAAIPSSWVAWGSAASGYPRSTPWGAYTTSTHCRTLNRPVGCRTDRRRALRGSPRRSVSFVGHRDVSEFKPDPERVRKAWRAMITALAEESLDRRLPVGSPSRGGASPRQKITGTAISAHHARDHLSRIGLAPGAGTPNDKPDIAAAAFPSVIGGPLWSRGTNG